MQRDAWYSSMRDAGDLAAPGKMTADFGWAGDFEQCVGRGSEEIGPGMGHAHAGAGELAPARIQFTV